MLQIKNMELPIADQFMVLTWTEAKPNNTIEGLYFLDRACCDL